MDENFSEIGTCANAELKPIYSSDPLNSNTNLSCSCSAEFCYLCQYIDAPRGPDSLDLNEHIKLLIAEGKEIQAIARAGKNSPIRPNLNGVGGEQLTQIPQSRPQ